MQSSRQIVFTNKSTPTGDEEACYLLEPKLLFHWCGGNCCPDLALSAVVSVQTLSVLMFCCVAGRCFDVSSLSESAALRIANTCPEDFVNRNKRFLTRVYPNSMRVDSSNYNPQDLWNCGCQLGM